MLNSAAKTVMEQLNHNLAAKNRLGGNSGDGDDAKPSEPATFVFGPHPNSQNDGENP
jgi:hypothetical protein